MDEKYLNYTARNLSKREGISFDEAKQKLLSDPAISSPNELIICTICGANVKGKNYDNHKKIHKKRIKIKWKNIPIIATQKEVKKNIKRAVGKIKTQIISGGSPGLGKRKS